MKKGKVGEKLKTALFKLYVCLSKRDLTVLKDRQRKTTVVMKFEVAKLLYYCLLNCVDEDSQRYSSELTQTIYNMHKSDQNSPNFLIYSDYEVALKDSLKEEYPLVKV